MHRIDDLLPLLKNDALRNLNLLNFVSQNPVLGVEKVGNSILVRGRSDRPWIYVSSTSEEELRILTGKLEARDIYFAAIEDWMIPILSRDKELAWKLSTIQFILPAEAKIPKAKYQVRALALEEAASVYENSDYKDYISTEYVKSRILCGPSAAIHENNQLIAWVMTQDDGAMGFLHVIGTYRNKGYGRSVMIALIEKLRQQAQMPFACIEENNRPAISFVSSFGFARDRMKHWFEVR